MYSKKMLNFVISALGIVFAVSICIGLSGDVAMAQCKNDSEFTTEFYLEECDGFATVGTNPFFILEIGYKLVLVGEEDGDEIMVEITVLDETELIEDCFEEDEDVVTRVVEEREYVNDVLIEVSRNFFAICDRTNSVYYFGEDVDECDLEERGGFDPGDESICLDGEEPDNGGEWRAGDNGAKPGLIMPGTFLLGSKYFQEIAWDDEAVDRGENVAMGLTVETEAGIFDDCVMVVDTNPAEGICKKRKGDVKIYCPGIGLVQDEEVELVEYGFE